MPFPFAKRAPAATSASVTPRHLWETVDFADEALPSNPRTAQTLREHERLIVQHADDLYAGMRRRYASLEDGSDADERKESFPFEACNFLNEAVRMVGCITSIDGRDTVTVAHGDDAKALVPHSARNVYRALFEPRPAEFHVVVVSDEAVSLREVGVEPENIQNPLTPMHLYLKDAGRVVVEPRFQRHWRLGRWILSVAATPRYFLRIDIVPDVPEVIRGAAPPPLDSLFQSELMDICFAASIVRLRQLLESDAAQRGWSAPSGPAWMEDAVGLVTVNRRAVSANLTTRALARGLTADFPRVTASLERAPVNGWIPVLVKTRQAAAVRWLRVTEDGDPEPAGISEPGKARRAELERLAVALGLSLPPTS